MQVLIEKRTYAAFLKFPQKMNSATRLVGFVSCFFRNYSRRNLNLPCTSLMFCFILEPITIQKLGIFSTDSVVKETSRRCTKYEQKFHLIFGKVLIQEDVQ